MIADWWCQLPRPAPPPLSSPPSLPIVVVSLYLELVYDEPWVMAGQLGDLIGRTTGKDNQLNMDFLAW